MTAVDTFRDALFGNPPSATWKPSREGQLAAFTELNKQAVVAQYAASAGVQIVATTADRDAIYADEANRGKLVYVNNNNGAADDPANGVYEYVAGAARIAQGFYDGLATVVQPLVDEAEQARDDAIAARDAIVISATGNGIARSARKAQAFNGAQFIYDENGPIGATIPTGQTGQSTLIRPGVEIDGAALAGRTARVAFIPETSATFTRNMIFGGVIAVRDALGNEADRSFTNVLPVSGGGFSADFVVQATDRYVFTFAQITSSTPTTVDEYFKVVRVEVRAIDGDGFIEANVESQIAAAIIAAAPYADSELLRGIKVTPQSGGAALYAANGDPIGLTIAAGVNPPGQHSGYNSIIQFPFAVDTSMAGALEEFLIVAELSPTFTRGTMSANLLIDKISGGPSGQTALSQYVQIGGKAYWRIVHQIAADDAAVAPYLALDTTTDNVVGPDPETVEVIFTARRYLTSVDPYRSAAEANRERFAASMKAKSVEMDAQGVFHEPVAVATSDNLEMVTAALKPSAGNPLALSLGAGVYGTGLSGFWGSRDYLDVTGLGKRSTIAFANPNDTARQNLLQGYTFTLVSQSVLEAVSLTAKNCRYVVHVDDNNGPSSYSHPSIVNCRLEHFGNADAVNYNAATDRCVAVGGGMSQGQIVTFDRSVLIGPDGGGLSMHNNRDARSPAHALFADSRDVAHHAWRYAGATSLGSGQADTMRWHNCVLPGGRVVAGEGWLSVDPDNQPSRRLEVGMFGAGCNPVAFYTRSRALAFRVRSASVAAGSKVELVPGGSADFALFGKFAEPKRGGAGLAAALFSADDRSGITVGPGAGGATYQTLNLGRALGDCSATAKSSSFKFQGGSAVTVTFNTDLTNASNDDVLAIVNSQLGSAGAADMWSVDNETHRGFFGDEEAPRNTTASAILRRTVVAWNGDKTAIRPMTSADSPSLFAGVAYEDILPGEAGRVKVRGYIALADVLYIESELSRFDYIGDANFASDSRNLQFGDSFGIDPTQPGRITTAGSGLLPMVIPPDTESNFSTVLEVGR